MAQSLIAQIQWIIRNFHLPIACVCTTMLRHEYRIQVFQMFHAFLGGYAE
jgi:hypothetical protein